MGYSFGLQQDAALASPAAATCQKHFGGWCLDGKHINRGGIIAIIVVGCVLVVAALVSAALLARRRQLKQKVLFSDRMVVHCTLTSWMLPTTTKAIVGQVSGLR